ncbi:ribosomal RNA processing protein 1 homolog [Daktulosphaira vitifoliae]|uniref:ribosomal RNA processing protein 1 homolog n=1 Tax=Daktulosphaira vitifoliae TaxID=58002 RepID=UPI0021AA7941|nr:ribosomal RNA processing protein 1 homolog [Daktulosphaira vitifoliae]
MTKENRDAEKVAIVEREIEFVKLVASNDSKTRNDGFKQLKSLIIQHSGDSNNDFQLNDYLRVWKGLFYFMWMSDKPLPQEVATEKISSLMHSCKSTHGKVLFLEAFFLTIKDDWMSISQHRIDKFMMLVRRFLRQTFVTCVNSDWNIQYMEKINRVLYNALKSFTLSLKSHVQEIFLEELAKVSKGNVPTEALVIILDAFLHYISEINDIMLIKEVTQNVFKNLLSQSPEFEILEAKLQAWRQMGRPGRSYTDLELVEGDIENGDGIQNYDAPLDPRAGKVNVEIPRIKFNPKLIAHLLHKYINEIDCTRKSLVELTKLLKWFNRLKEGVLPFKPKDLKLNSQVLKRKKKRHLSKLVKDGVKRLEMVDQKIKKSSRDVLNNCKSLKELDMLGEVIVEHGKIGKSVWKVRKFVENNAKENISLNGSWTVSEEEKNVPDESCAIEEEFPILVPAGFNVETSVNNLPNKYVVQEKKQISPLNKENVKSPTTKSCKVKSSLTNKNNITEVDTNQSDDLVMKKLKRRSGDIRDNSSLNESWSVTQNDEIKIISTSTKNMNDSFENKKNITGESDSKKNLQANSNENLIETNMNLSKNWHVSKGEKEPDLSYLNESIQNISKNSEISKLVSPGSKILSENSKSPKSPTPEKRVLRRRTIIIPKKKDVQKEQTKDTPKRKSQDSSQSVEIRKRRKTIAGQGISHLNPDEISNKALEKVRSEAFDGFSTPRKSSRLSIKTDSAKKRVEFQLKNNIEQEFNEYETSLVEKPENPHDASKQPICGVLKSTPDTNRVNPFYKFHDRSIKKNSRKSII